MSVLQFSISLRKQTFRDANGFPGKWRLRNEPLVKFASTNQKPYPFRVETVGDVAKCRLFPWARFPFMFFFFWNLGLKNIFNWCEWGIS